MSSSTLSPQRNGQNPEKSRRTVLEALERDILHTIKNRSSVDACKGIVKSRLQAWWSHLKAITYTTPTMRSGPYLIISFPVMQMRLPLAQSSRPSWSNLQTKIVVPSYTPR